MATKNNNKNNTATTTTKNQVVVEPVVNQVASHPVSSPQVSSQGDLNKRIMDSVREARNSGVFSASDFVSSLQNQDGKVNSVKSLNFKNKAGAELTLKSIVKADSKLPSFELGIKVGDKLTVLKGDVAQKCFHIASKELKGRRRKSVLDQTQITELSAFF